MSEANVALVRRMLEAHNQGPEVFLAEFERFFHTDCEWIPVIVGGLEQTRYRGKEGFTRWYAERDDALDEASVEIISCESVRDDVVLVLARSVARGRTSGARVDEEVGIVLRLREGLIARDEAFASHAEARRAARA